ncbi:MAG: isoleucine--tRNA ligase [Chitinophagaceae bacterium]|nr:isoleucine--tRNA ligase [Chitinophagaceae bacterium]
MSGKYTEYKQLNLPSISEEILAKWKKEGTFEKSVELREGKTPFVFYEGPPSANGMPGIHHVISRTLKDLVCRYKTMQGFQVKRKGGWDTHGLPIELGVEKELGITKEDIGVKISVEDYNKKCREVVMRFKDKWDDITQKMGYWVDLKNPYVTFENNYIETLWWCLSELYKKGFLYESVSIQPYSPAAGTGLSSHELNQPGTYKDVKDTSAVAMFKISQKSKVKIKNFDGEAFLMAWTTTPWTLPSNLGLTVGPNIDYALLKTFNPYTHLPINVILAKALIGKYFKPEGEKGDFENYNAEIKLQPWKIIAEFKGSELEGLTYEQLLPSEANTLEKIQEITPGAEPFRVLLGDFVTTEDGTGIVHTAPAFGADDFRIGQKNNIGILTLVDKQGKFVEGVGEFSNRYVKNYKDEKDYVDVNIDIAVKLKKENRAFKVEKYEHNYPHCWRTDKPIIYYPLDAWFIKTTAVKERMVELNKTINWKPANTGTGRFGNWLENVVDWNLSRSRFWGTPLPIWKTEDGEEEICIGSVEELNNEIKKAAAVLGGETNKHYLHEGILDLHKPYVDEITLVSATGKPMQRVPDLIDVWFDSGAMPYAQWHFPFENVEAFSKSYPADFIAEGVDQTRGWFYTLHALAALLKESIDEKINDYNAANPAKPALKSMGTGLAYKTVVSNGLVLDKAGNKMSKRLGNVVDPFVTIDHFGADATRWYLITNASPWDSLKFDVEGIKEVQRKFFGTLYNTYQFFALYANVDGFAFKETYIPVKERPEIDQWILSSLNSLIKNVQENFDDYEPTQAGRAIEDFVDAHLSNWYVRLSRRRFWKGEYEHDKISAYQTLYECLETLCKLMAPVAPFFADWLFNNLNVVSNRFTSESVHLTDFPKPDETVIDIDLEKRMQLAQDISSLILSLRKKVNLKVRQPLQKVLIPALDNTMAARIKKVADIIKAETNIKEIDILGAENDFIRKKAKANFKTLGKKLGAKMKWAAEQIAAFDNATIDKVLENEYVLNPDHKNTGDEPVIINAEDLEISTDEIPGYEVAVKGPLTVALDIVISVDLKKEGDAREFVNRVQNIRKDSGFNLTDRIDVMLSENGAIQPSIIQYKDYICAEILADSLVFLPEINNGIEIEVNDAILQVNVLKKG